MTNQLLARGAVGMCSLWTNMRADPGVRSVRANDYSRHADEKCTRLCALTVHCGVRHQLTVATAFILCSALHRKTLGLSKFHDHSGPIAVVTWQQIFADLTSEGF